MGNSFEDLDLGTGRLPARNSSRAKQPARWSLTMPQACMVAYAVTGPVKVKPWRLSSALSALAAGVLAGTSASVRGAAAGSAAYFQTSALSPSGRLSAARALTSTALI